MDPRQVRLAVAPIAWSNDDMPELGGDTPLEVCLSESRAAGFRGTELGGKFPRDAAALGPLLASHDLQLAGGWFSGRLRDHGSVQQELQRMRAQLECFATLGTGVVCYAEISGSVQGVRGAPLSARPRMAAADFPAYGEQLTDLATAIMAEYGVILAYHPHMGTVIETEPEVDRLMAHSGEAVGLLVDSGHAAFAGTDAVALFTRHAPRVRHLHCKDVRAEVLAAARTEDWSFLDSVMAGVFTVPGDGCLDFHALLAAAAAADYRGWLVVEAEQDPAKANPLEYSRKGGAHLRACCAGAGLEVIE